MAGNNNENPSEQSSVSPIFFQQDSLNLLRMLSEDHPHGSNAMDVLEDVGLYHTAERADRTQYLIPEDTGEDTNRQSKESCSRASIECHVLEGPGSALDRWPQASLANEFCTLCLLDFTLTRRRHHCRACGRSFCHDCSKLSIPLPDLNYHTSVRVCDECYSSRIKNLSVNVTSDNEARESMLDTLQRSLRKESELRTTISASLLDVLNTLRAVNSSLVVQLQRGASIDMEVPPPTEGCSPDLEVIDKVDEAAHILSENATALADANSELDSKVQLLREKLTASDQIITDLQNKKNAAHESAAEVRKLKHDLHELITLLERNERINADLRTDKGLIEERCKNLEERLLKNGGLLSMPLLEQSSDVSYCASPVGSRQALTAPLLPVDDEEQTTCWMAFCRCIRSILRLHSESGSRAKSPIVVTTREVFL